MRLCARLLLIMCAAQAPKPAVQPAAQPTPQAPPDTEIYLLPMKIADGAITLGAPADITNNPGYDNQPFFTADSRSILFTSVRSPTAPSAPRADTTTPAAGAPPAGSVPPG